MNRVVRRRAIVTALVLLCLAVLMLWVFPVGLGDDTARAVKGTGTADVRSGSETFTISGDTTQPMSPGVTVPLDLTITNPHDFPLLVQHLVVGVRAISAPNRTGRHPCTVGDYAVTQALAGLRIQVAPHSTASLTSLDVPTGHLPRIGMLDRSVNQDGCKNARLTLVYTASGAQVDR